MSSKKKPRPTLADYVTITLSPVLIMALVGSLIFFLLEVLYVGQYSGRMQWTLFFFVFGSVLIARISIEHSDGRALLYGIGLGLVVWLALQAFVEYPPGSAMRAFSWAANLGLLALAWWCAHRLTWDCTHIDETVDAAGKGVLEAAGLGDREDEDEEPNQSEAEPAPRRPARSRGLLAWWDRYGRYRQEQLRKPHTPGVWVVYFSLAALPLFGLGQALIPAADTGRRHYAFWLMVCYVGSGLTLLVTTSFLGLRRYLRQRQLKMPAAMTGVWMALGAGLIVTLMIGGALLPRPYGEYQLIHFNPSTAKERDASRYAVLREGAGKGEGRPSLDKATRTEDGRSASGKQGDRESGTANDGQGGSKDGKSGRQNPSSEKSRSGRTSGEDDRSRNDGPQANRNDANSQNRREEPNRPTGSPNSGQKDPGRPSDASQRNGETTSLPENPLGHVLEKLGWLGTVLKWLVFAVLALAVLFFVLRSGLNFLANFTNWAKQLLESLQAWWQGLFGRADGDSESQTEESSQQPAPRPFASFGDPFGDGRAAHLSPDALVRYSFEALEAWAREHDLGRQAEETPLEFAERLCTAKPELETEVRSLAGLYVRLAYARSSLKPACLDSLKRFWQCLTREEKPISV